ncbi:hypothetical protein K440DRAFT_636878 [Wilcoxina mikolae CBS 423.85]|nr:hypothetical protein K440DRAFT_636878 [Wilcoxina mikolae CBS 423.85]
MAIRRRKGKSPVEITPKRKRNVKSVLTSVIEARILPVETTVNEAMSDLSPRIQELWGVRCEPGDDEGPGVRDVASIFNDKTTLAWLRSMINLEVQTLYCFLRRNNEVPNTPINVGMSFLPLAEILLQEKEMIDDIGEESNDELASSIPSARGLPSSLANLVARDKLIQRRLIRKK